MTAPMTHNFLLTGASGFLGQVVQEQLKDKGTLQSLRGCNDVDLCQIDSLLSLSPARHIIHLAGVVGIPDFEKDIARGYGVNVGGTLNLLRYAVQNKSKTFVYVSTYMYGAPNYLPIDEKHPLACLHAYHQSKKMAEDLCLQFAQAYGIKLFVLRVFNIYGPGQSKSMLIPTIISQLKQQEIKLRDPFPKRDYLFVSDVARAIALCFEEQALPGIYNIGSGISWSVDELVTHIQSAAQTSLPVNYSHQHRPTEVSDVRADFSLAKRYLNWSPEITLEAGLKYTLCEF